ncbi:uncharacterized protein DUF5017 [Dyadobacter jejuensis]|uniref:Uncharacterized protein DUF5017 n=1 Tax=Dyadobacter jejuensis TaxID=1082580 RepID=A0A316AI00_9BACT|nr:DUF5017 domain-containing protein [Dyadobacter jejuensis]PWJ56908.1 uncharacterized protein DUF5017 [Dyadobacter jejuensis]
MQKNIFHILLVGLLALNACNQPQLTSPSLEVTTPKTTYQVGEPVEFSFSGNPDFITFYSGEVGKRQAYVKRLSAEGTPTLQFTSARANGSQPNSLIILASNDFVGFGATTDESWQNVRNATWIDLTSQAKLSTGSSTSSGAIDLSSAMVVDKSTYIAFKYVGEVGSKQNKWTISNLKVSNELPDGTSYTLANHTSTAITNYGVNYGMSPGWRTYLGSASYNWSVSTTSLVITGATSDAAATVPAEAWAITGPIDLTRVSPDLGTFLKGMTTKETGYTYQYNTPGTYQASFVAANNLLGEEKQVVKTVTITVTE